MEPKPRPPLTHTRVNDQGLIEIVDLHTGRILCVQRQPGDEFLQNKFDNLVRLETPEGVVWIDKTINPQLIRNSPFPAYSKGWADMIAEKMLEPSADRASSSLSRACRSLGLPYALVCRWRREYPEFKEILDATRKDLAELKAEEALETAHNASESSLGPAKLKVSALQWDAERSDPERFGTKKQVDHKHEGAISFTLDTGIRRKGDKGYNSIELKDVTGVAPGISGEAGQTSLDGQGDADIEGKIYDGGGEENDRAGLSGSDRALPESHTEAEARQEAEPVLAQPSTVHMGEASPVGDIQGLRPVRTFD